MRLRDGLLLGFGSAVAQAAIGSFGAWTKDQINTSICTWQQPRAALIRDTIYLDGGDIYWTAGLSTGGNAAPQNFPNDQGVILSYNLSEPFSTSSNITSLLLKYAFSKNRGALSSVDQTPNYYDGGMLANYDSFFLYGGAPFLINFDDAPAGNDVLGYEAYAQEPGQSIFSPGFEDAKLPTGMNDYMAFGAAVSVPSENLGWYFPGMVSPSHGPIYFNEGNFTTNSADDISNNFVALDMSEQFHQTWTNTTLPPHIQGRANPEVVWVPVGEQGILVVLGGVTFPQWVTADQTSSDPSASEKESPVFMQTIDVYDIANDVWYQQPANNTPGTRTRGCAVVASASDLSSFNIFYYGGFDGVDVGKAFHDDVWALSLPSFEWIEIDAGEALHARAGHKCFMPYPDQMMVFAGYIPQSSGTQNCLDDGPVVLFNVTSGEWLDSYDPTKYGTYGVHEKIQDVIGGDSAGGAKAREPSNGWATSGLGKVFDTPYDMHKISSYWPYPLAATSPPNSGASNPSNSTSGHSGLPSWVAPVLGVVLGLAAITGATVLFCLWRKRHMLTSRNSEPSTEDAGMRIMSWMRGHGPEKEPTVTTSEVPASALPSPGLPETNTVTSTPQAFPWSRHEMDDTAIAELGDTSRKPELHDTGMSPLEFTRKHGRLGSDLGSMFSGSDSDFRSISRSSGAANSPPLDEARMDSPSLGHAAELDSNNFASSGSNPWGPSHARQTSETSLGSTGMHYDERPGVGARTTSVGSLSSASPISPPSTDEAPGSDYLSARPIISPIHQTVLRENLEE